MKKKEEKKKPSYIKLVTSHGKKVGKTPVAVKEQKKEEPEKEQVQEEIESRYTSVTRLLKPWAYRVLLMVGATTTGFLCAREETYQYQITRGYPTDDLDKNGVNDWITIQQNGHKLPLYGVEYEGKVMGYYPGHEMKKISRIAVDYEGIEEKLNE